MSKGARLRKIKTSRKYGTPKDVHDVPWTEQDKEFIISNAKKPIKWPLDDIVLEKGVWRLMTHTNSDVKFSVRADLVHHV